MNSIKIFLVSVCISVVGVVCAQNKGYDNLGVLCQISIFMDEIGKSNDLVYRIPQPEPLFGELSGRVYGPGRPHLFLGSGYLELHFYGPILKLDLESYGSYMVIEELYVDRWFNTQTFKYTDSASCPGTHWVRCYYEIQLMKDKLY